MSDSHRRHMESVYAEDVYPALGLDYCHLGYWQPDNAADFHRAQADYIEVLANPLGLGPGDTVLDVGGGTGATAIWLHRRYGCRVVSVDIVEAQVERGRALVAAAGLQAAVELVCADVLAWTPAGAPFDHVLSIGAIHHVPDLPELVRRLHGWLKPGGQVAASTYALDLPIPLLRDLYLELTVANRRLPRIDRYRPLFEAAGFTGFALEDVSDRTLHPSSARLWAPPFRAPLVRWHREHYGRIGAGLFEWGFTPLHFRVLRARRLSVHFLRAVRGPTQPA